MSAGVGEHAAVAEMQGLDGAFSFAERLLQRIWLHGDFDVTRAVTTDGRKVNVLNPGSWNRLGGPDFFRATLEIAGQRMMGDVELHVRAADWRAHGHPGDPKYHGVILHVVLFPPHSPTLSADGKEIPVLALLPLLYRSLEEYAEEEAVERLANHPLTVAHEALLALSPQEQRATLLEFSNARWKQKRSLALKRVERLGWREACHQTALEILGYRFNRGPMLLLASEHPLDSWPSVAEGASFERLQDAYAPRWNRQAVRPANHPTTRLRQYARWTKAVPNWPEQLREVVAAQQLDVAPENSNTADFRKTTSLLNFIKKISDDVCGGAMSGTRLQTLIADGFWPLLAAKSEEATATIFETYWYHGYCGDVPDRIRKILAALELTRPKTTPLCHGIAQGLLGWVWREEARLQQTTACSCGRGT